MSDNIDFKALWNRGEGCMPNVNEIFAKADKLNRCIRKRIWWGNITLSATVIFMIGIWWYYQPQMLTTKVGLSMIIAGIIALLVVSNQQSRLLVDSNVETDSRHYLAQLIRVKHKQEFLGTTMMAIYIICLSIGLSLYMIEYVSRGSLTFKVLAYGISLAWMAFNLFYIAPRKIKKQRRAINEIIEKLEAVNGQLISPESGVESPES